MNQNIFCSKCHRIPSQCCCSSAKELTDEEIEEVFQENIRQPNFMMLGDTQRFARAILKKAREK